MSLLQKYNTQDMQSTQDERLDSANCDFCEDCINSDGCLPSCCCGCADNPCCEKCGFDGVECTCCESGCSCWDNECCQKCCFCSTDSCNFCDDCFDDCNCAC